jgi:hypothetical protein
MNQDHGQILFAASSSLYAVSHLDPRVAQSVYNWNGLDHYAYSKMWLAQLARLLGQKLVNESSRIKVNCKSVSSPTPSMNEERRSTDFYSF